MHFLHWRLAALVNGLKDATAYRIEFVLEFLGAAAVPAAIQWLLWYAMFKVDGRTEINGLTYSDLISYTLASVLFSQVRGGDHDFELQEMIRTGQLSQYLLRPVSAVEFVYIRGVAPKLLIAGGCLAIGLILSPFLGYSPLRVLGAMFLAFIGNIIHYQIGAALATTAFYWEEAFSVLMVKNLLVSILSGELIPLYLFPQSMEWLWKSTPFYLYVFGPVQFALGKWSYTEYCQSLVLAGMWLCIGWILIRISWSIGIRRYQSLGN